MMALKGQWITKVITLHPKGDVNVCANSSLMAMDPTVVKTCGGAVAEDHPSHDDSLLGTVNVCPKVCTNQSGTCLGISLDK